jgi:outer membrane lipoprotein-sorting protein
MITVILLWGDKPLQTVIKVAGFWAMLTAYHSMALVLHSCAVQNTEKGMSIKVEKLQTYVKTQNKTVQSGTETNQDTKKGVTRN